MVGIIFTETLRLSNNVNINGSIPIEFGNLTNLQELQLKGCDLSGSMPDEICALRTDADPAGQLSVLVADCGGATPEPVNVYRSEEECRIGGERKAVVQIQIEIETNKESLLRLD
eukprot:scaffold6346_cov75-Skeletonema_dohrnii-CCMP3373.AAC.2